MDGDDGPFHFGERLAEVVRRHELERLIYLGAGSATLMANDDFFSLGHYLGMAWNMVLTNNRYSADFAAFVPGKALFQVSLPAKDNVLPRVLHDEAGLTLQELPRAPRTSSTSIRPRTSRSSSSGATPVLASAEWFEARKSTFRDTRLVWTPDRSERAGTRRRDGSEARSGSTWRGRPPAGSGLSPKSAACALKGEKTGRRARCWLTTCSRWAAERFFAELAEMADAAFIDTRVIFAHMSRSPSRADRFLSDLGRYEEIDDPFLREFTEAAMKARIPVLLGGHSLVAGGLMALTELAWADVPEPPE